MDFSFLTRFAVTYDCNAYGASTYNNDEPCTTTETSTTTTTPANTSGLASTGTSVALGITAGILLIIVGVIIMMKLRRDNKKAPRT